MSTAMTELCRFLSITGQRLRNGQSAPEMFSPAVDAAWHQMLATSQYVALCQETAGQPIRHVANNGHGPIGWVTSYEEMYGPLPQIWFTDARGVVNHDAEASYRQSGTVVAEWDCSPIGGGGDDDVAPQVDDQ
ncbi:hypothetical protein [Streptomyces chumphonensis]|uniref:hypothetical protein n=1 Tax=Streptomyces chumphonensis TaxID=1214925 RepID=UPI003D714CEC